MCRQDAFGRKVKLKQTHYFLRCAALLKLHFMETNVTPGKYLWHKRINFATKNQALSSSICLCINRMKQWFTCRCKRYLLQTMAKLQVVMQSRRIIGDEGIDEVELRQHCA